MIAVLNDQNLILINTAPTSNRIHGGILPCRDHRNPIPDTTFAASNMLELMWKAKNEE